jgi:hypothetical protein
VKVALDRGLHMGFSCGNDDGGALPFHPTCYTGIYGVSNFTREGIYAALLARHTWAAESKTKMDLHTDVGGTTYVMGDILNFSSPSPALTVYYAANASEGKTISNVSIFYNGVIVNVTQFPGSHNVNGSHTQNFTDGHEDYIFIEAIDSDGKRAWSSPLYITYSNAGGAPEISAISISPPSPNATTTLSCNVTALDNFSSAPTLNITWLKGGSTYSSTAYAASNNTPFLANLTLSPSFTQAGDNWSCAAWANNSFEVSGTNYSANVTVAEPGCADLSDPSTWHGRLTNQSGIVYINSGAELCAGDYPNVPLRINSSGISLDCAGARLEGSGPAGINTSGFDGLNISNCDISGFTDGLMISGSSGCSFNNITIHGNSGYAIVADSTTGNTLSNIFVYGQPELISAPSSSGNAFTNLTVGVNAASPQVFWPSATLGALDVTGSELAYGDEYVSLDSVAVPELNTSATISLNIGSCTGFDPSKIYYAEGFFTSASSIISSGSPCPGTICSGASCAGGILTFDVTHFTCYAYGSGANLTIDNNGPMYEGQNITFNASYVNSTSGAPISGASCNLTLYNGSTYPMSEVSSYYETNVTVFVPGTHNYNITCSASGYPALTAFDTYQVNGNASNATITLNGANVTVISTSKYQSNISAGNFTTEGGNVTSANLDTNASTEKWAGFYGNTSGNLLLSENNTAQYMYLWIWNSSNGGVVCLSTNPSLSSFSASGANGTDIDSTWGFTPADADSGINTYNGTGCALQFGSESVSGASYADTGSAGGFQTCALKTAATPAKNEMLFCVNITYNGAIYNGKTGDFEAMVPTPQAANTFETYYFYMSLD